MLKTSDKSWARLRVLLLFSAALVYLCWRARYGLSFDDEPFLITLAQRLYHGDTLFIDEWNLAQNAGVLLLPFYQLYRMVFGSIDRIFLVFRWTYCLLWAGTCTAVYAALRQRYRSAVVVFFYLVLFSPTDQMSLSYTSFGLMGCLLIATLFYYHLELRPLKSGTFAVLFSALSIITVIAVPYMAVVYALFVIGCLAYSCFKRDENGRWWRRVVLISVGLVVLALILYAWRFCFSSCSVTEFFEQLPAMFATSKRFADAPAKAWNHLGLLFMRWPFFCSVLAVSVGLGFVPCIRRSVTRRAVLFAVDAFAFLLELLYLEVDCGMYQFNHEMVPVALLGLAAFCFLPKASRPWKLFWCYFGFGIVYSLVYQLSSNTGIKALALGVSVCGAAAVVCMELLVREWFSALSLTDSPGCGCRRWVKIVAALGVATLFACQLALQVSLKIERQFYDVPLYKMDATVNSGAAKGVKTIRYNSDSYEENLRTLDTLLENVDQSRKEDILFMSLVCDPVLYVEADLPIGAFSAWNYTKNSDKEAFVDKTRRYYAVNPSKTPNVILFAKGDRELLEEIGLDTTRYVLFSEDEYYLLVMPELVNTSAI